MPLKPKLGPSNSFVCFRCQRQAQSASHVRRSDFRRLGLRYFSLTNSQYADAPVDSSVPNASRVHGFARLTNRSLIRLDGPDVVNFLNGLLPARLQSSPKEITKPIFTAFLSAKGRILYDAFLYPPVNSPERGPWYIDVDSASAPAVFSHLKKHKLRSKFKLEKVPPQEMGVYYIWPGASNTEVMSPAVGGQDPRPLMGTRFLSPADSAVLSFLQDQGTAYTLDDYRIHRMITGHAEGPQELIPNSALPQESNLDFSGGIDFHKGCYLGQELTIRTHHTGVVRKRILPCRISSDTIPSDEDALTYDPSSSALQPVSESSISKIRSTGRAGRSTGKWLDGVGNIGLALCRLEMMTDIELTAEGTGFDPSDQYKIVWEVDEAGSDGKTTVQEVVIKPFVPVWLRRSIESGIKARADRGKKRRQQDEDENELD